MIDVGACLVEADCRQDDRVGELWRQRVRAMGDVGPEREAHQRKVSRFADVAGILLVLGEMCQALEDSDGRVDLSIESRNPARIVSQNLNMTHVAKIPTFQKRRSQGGRRKIRSRPARSRAERSCTCQVQKPSFNDSELPRSRAWLVIRFFRTLDCRTRRQFG